MEPERWQRVQALFEAAVELDSAARDALLSAEPDPQVADEVRSLLAVDDADSSPLDGGALRPPEGLAPGTPVGEYVIEERIGAGAFGVVYRAVHPVLKKRAAVKVLDRRFSSDEATITRFVTEARAASTIGHRGIVDVFGFGALDNGSHYYLMEYVDGPSLAEYIKAHAPLSVDVALTILEALADTLDAAHRHGIVHRDLKPANVMLAIEDGRPNPKLVDFGIAKLLGDASESSNLTETGATLGTPAYMAPEQARGRDVESAADRYALGVISFEMVTGQRPFTADSTIETMMKHLNAEPPRPSSVQADLPAAVDAAILALLAKTPSDRPATATAAVAAFRTTPLKTMPSRSARWPVLVGGLGAIGIVSAAMLWSTSETKAPVIEVPPEAPPPPVARVEPPPAPIRTDVRIEGSPEGARILDAAGTEVGRLPATITVVGPNDEHEFVIQQRGFASKRIRLVPAERARIDVALKKKIHRDLENPF